TGSSLVKAVVELAHALDMVAVAEGVETAQQQQRLDEIGADLSQGYLHHRPMDLASVTALLVGRASVALPLR
ncbi:MAG: EAL domain-containing protein, partial [Actinobacteria bacterium]|nr:EAL domain-containing protein [Actinomycetota bacterium]